MDVNEYLKQIEELRYEPICDELWEVIQEANLVDMTNNPKAVHWVQAKLKITEEDQKGIIELNDIIVDKFNDLDLKVKDFYGKNVVGLVDFDLGEVLIVKLL